MFEPLKRYHEGVKDRKILSLFDDPARVDAFSVRAADLVIDYSKTQLDDDARAQLLALAEARGVSQKRDDMFAGNHINVTEDRAVLHSALRAAKGTTIYEDGKDVVAPVHDVLAKMAAFTNAVRKGEIKGSTGRAFTDIVNIGIGGSDLGPVMAVRALAPYHDGPRTHFVSNIDSAHIHDTLSGLDPETTLILIASKTFTTIETMTNAETAKAWLSGLPDPSAHFAAISTALEKTAEFGILPERVFGFEDWVGGRYSLWGPIGLSIMLAIGAERFEEFLSGARAIDDHFQNAQGVDNAPLMLGLIGIWHRNICDYPTRAILPYEERLSRFPAYLQQLDMESNGKSVEIDGSTALQTGPVVWGEPGTNGQHAFYQLIHQGTDVIPCEFLVAKRGHEPALSHQHNLLKANCLAQSRALMIGRSYEEALEISHALGYEDQEAERQAKHRVFAGNRPSITITYDQLTPAILGQLIALYEHRVFVEGAIWGINSFDQWGVELGKILAKEIEPAFEGKTVEGLDPSTEGLLKRLS